MDLSVLITNVGDDNAHDVRVRQVWHEGLGPVVFEVDQVEPEAEIAVKIACTEAELECCSMVVEWADPAPRAGVSRSGASRHRHSVPFRHLMSRPRLSLA